MDNLLKNFRDSKMALKLATELSNYRGKEINIMEVCGTHTMAIFKYGIRDLLPKSIRLLSGPGCPICVTPESYIDNAIELSEKEDIIITTFGDMMRVPGSRFSLMHQRAKNKDIRVVYSPLDSLIIAKKNTNKKVVFLSVGFETTTPVIALTISKAREEGITNFFILTANKTIPNALKALANDKDIDGFLYPGHVSAIIGTSIYEELNKKNNMSGIITGFEPLDIMFAIKSLVEHINNDEIVFKNQYSRIVKRNGNEKAIRKIYEIFEPHESEWRGIGIIESSGLRLSDDYKEFDAQKVFGLEQNIKFRVNGCICGDILRGKKTPPECRQFGTNCTPQRPIGACMVSSEGTCAAYYKYCLK